MDTQSAGQIDQVKSSGIRQSKFISLTLGCTGEGLNAGHTCSFLVDLDIVNPFTPKVPQLTSNIVWC